MTFVTIHLDIEKEEAHELIINSVTGLRSKRVDNSIEYRNSAGMLLAVLSTADWEKKAKSKLRYQTAVIAPFLAHGRVKASEIRHAVDSHRIIH